MATIAKKIEKCCSDESVIRQQEFPKSLKTFGQSGTKFAAIGHTLPVLPTRQLVNLYFSICVIGSEFRGRSFGCLFDSLQRPLLETLLGKQET